MSERLRDVAAVSAASMVLILSGCSIGNSKPVTITSQEINELLHPTYPSDLQRVEDDTVRVEAYYDSVKYVTPEGGNLGTIPYYSGGTGTEVTVDGHEEVVTAAHVLINGPRCAGPEEIIYPGKTQASVRYAHVKTFSPANITSDNADGTSVFNYGNDAVAISPSEFSVFSPIPVQEDVNVAPGDLVLSLGYGEREGAFRSPDAEASADRQPVVVPGIVLNSSDSQITYLTLGGTYTSVQGGDSGGTGVDKYGNYVGDVVLRTPGDGSSLTAAQVESRENIKLPENASKLSFAVSSINLVNATNLRNLIETQGPCTLDPIPSLTRTVPDGTNIHIQPPPTVPYQ